MSTIHQSQNASERLANSNAEKTLKQVTERNCMTRHKFPIQ
jgi:hypothetical protein